MIARNLANHTARVQPRPAWLKRDRQTTSGMRRVLLILVALTTACGEPEPPALRVGPVAFTEAQLLGLSEARRETLADITAVALAVADSTTVELGRPWIDAAVEDRLLEILAAELTLARNGVDDDVLEAHYLTAPQWELVVRHILFFSERWRSPDHRAEAEAKAERALEALRAGADFAETAATLSEEPGAEGRQGLLTPGREGSWVPEFWAAALALEPGEISPVTETQYGYHILRLEDRRVVPFAEARPVVARAVARQIEDPRAVLEEWMAELMTGQEEVREIALAEAETRGLAVPEAERAEITRAWEDLTYQWQASLGLRYGLSPQEVGAAALDALARPGQGADLTRSALATHRRTLRARYPAEAPSSD